MSENLNDIRHAIQQNEVSTARRLIKAQMRVKPTAELYFLASKVAISDAQAGRLLLKAAQLDPSNHEIRSALALARFKASFAASRSTSAPAAATSSGGSMLVSEEVIQRERRMQSILLAPRENKFEHAGFFTRWLAYVADTILATVALFVISFLLGMCVLPVSMPHPQTVSSVEYEQALNFHSTVLSLISIVIVQAFFISYFCTSRGRTPGKKMMRICVIRKDREDITLVDAFMRNFLGYMISGLIVGLGFLWSLLDDEKQTWHDKLVDTIVVKDISYLN